MPELILPPPMPRTDADAQAERQAEEAAPRWPNHQNHTNANRPIEPQFPSAELQEINESARVAQGALQDLSQNSVDTPETRGQTL